MPRTDRDLPKLITWLCLVVYLVAGTLRAPESVLCVGPNGHVAIEVAHGESHCDGCPTGRQQTTQPGTRIGVPDHGECPCVDFPLGTANEVASTRLTLPLPSETKPDLNVDGRVAVTVPAYAWPSQARAPGNRAALPTPAGQLDRIRTVILLI